MRFLFVAPRFHTNQHYAVKALIERGHEVAFFALRRGGSEEWSALQPTLFGYSRVFTAFAGREPDLRRSRAFAIPPIRPFLTAVRSFKPTAVVVRDPMTAYGALGIAGASLAHALPILYTQSPLYGRRTSAGDAARRSLARALGAEWITPVLGSSGNGSPAPLSHYVPFVIEPGVDPRSKEWFRNDVVNIINVGKFRARKRHVMFVEAIKRLSERFRVKATIIGESTGPRDEHELRRVTDAIRALGLAGTVEVRTNLPFFEVQREYAQHDLFVLASRDEQAAVSPLEAMASACAVVSSDTNGTRCYVAEGVNGLTFQTDELDDLVAKVGSIISDRSGLRRMGAASHEIVKRDHSPERYAVALEAIAARARRPN